MTTTQLVHDFMSLALLSSEANLGHAPELLSLVEGLLVLF